MSPVQRTEESLDKDLNSADNKMLADGVIVELRYLLQQHRNSRQREYLIKQTAFNIIRKVREEPFINDGKMDKEPF